MNNSRQLADDYHFADFTHTNYRRLLRMAKTAYVFRSYASFEKHERFVLWRHDVDLSMHSALKLAQIELEEGVQATYFINIHSEFYNALERDVSRCIHEIVGFGHHIGVHFDAAYYGIDSEVSLHELISREARLLADTFGIEPSAVSFHNPTVCGLEYQRSSYGGLVNTYARYFREEVGYCSDSNGYWRHRRLEDVLASASDPRLQVLTHDGMWQDEPMSPAARVERCIRGRAERTREFYAALLRDNPSRLNVGADD